MNLQLIQASGLRMRAGYAWHYTDVEAGFNVALNMRGQLEVSHLAALLKDSPNAGASPDSTRIGPILIGRSRE